MPRSIPFKKKTPTPPPSNPFRVPEYKDDVPNKKYKKLKGTDSKGYVKRRIGRKNLKKIKTKAYPPRPPKDPHPPRIETMISRAHADHSLPPLTPRKNKFTFLGYKKNSNGKVL